MPTADLYYFKLRFNDWLLDPDVCTLTPAQRSVYMDLLCHCHRSEDGTIPSDKKEALASMARTDRFEDIEAVLPFFNEVRPGRISHWQVMEDKADLGGQSVANSESGRRGGLKSGETRRKKASKRALRKQRSERFRSGEANASEATKQIRSDQIRPDHSASAPPAGARSREMSTPQSEPLTSPAGSAPAARAEGAAPARPASAPVEFNPHWPPAPGYLGTQGWRIDPLTGTVVQPPGWQSQPVGDAYAAERPAPAVPPPTPAPAQPAGDPKAEERARRAATVRAQAAAVLAATSPEERAAVEARLAEQDAAAAPAPLPLVAEGGDA